MKEILGKCLASGRLYASVKAAATVVARRPMVGSRYRSLELKEKTNGKNVVREWEHDKLVKCIVRSRAFLDDRIQELYSITLSHAITR